MNSAEMVKPTSVSSPTASHRSTLVNGLIVDVPTTIGKSVEEIEGSLGISTEIQPILVGEEIALSNGGESRTYHIGKYSFDLCFDRDGVARGFRLFEGLEEEN